MALRKVAESPAPITSLASHDGVLIASVSTGQLAYFNNKSNSLDLLLDTHGGPRGITVDPKSGDVFFTDAIRKAVVKLELPSAAGSAINAAQQQTNSVSMSQLWDVLKSCSESSSSVWQQSTQLRSFIDSFMDTPLKGPHGVVFDARGEIYVSDPGSLGDTGLTNPNGSILRSIANCQQVVPLAASGLAFPCGIATNTKTGAIFVCELSTNRLLRFVSRTPAGQQQQQRTSPTQQGGSDNEQQQAALAAASSSMIGSVFHQFAGSLGPMCVAIDSDTNLIYVSRFDFAHCRSNSKNADGEVVVLNGETGEEAGRIVVPGCEITALALDPVGKNLYIGEGKNLYCMSVDM